MSKPITITREQIWNERFSARMQELHLSQRAFIQKYRERFGTGSQSDVSNWMHVGEIDGKSKRVRNFPEFKTMRQIAEVLEVSVSYLIGESDFESYDIEKATKFLGLSADSIKSICNITTGKAFSHSGRHPDLQINYALDSLLSNHNFLEYLENLAVLLNASKEAEKLNEDIEKILDSIPPAFQLKAITLWHNAEAAINMLGIAPSDQLWEYVKFIDDSIDQNKSEILEKEIKALRYALQESNTRLVDGILNAASKTN